ncbi:MAG: carboxypeptidase regulatory-like domain-containing protein [Planctomycetes bacterium]|nr:carboxypeptidase regulatory-like domain-containing protein [Planctomycetota bacterium]
MKPPRVATAILLLLAATTLLGPAREEEESVTPYLPYLPGTEPLDDSGARLLGAIFVAEAPRPGSVRPIAGARVQGFTEDGRPVAITSRLVSEATTDEFGIANVPNGPEPADHWLIDAAGFGVVHHFGNLESFDVQPFLLRVTGDRRLRVLDPFGEPLAGARVELLLGCPHSPAARVATTDREGLAVLADVSDEGWELWILADGIAPGPYGLPATPCAGEPPALLTGYGATARGLVVNAAGEPLAGVVVRELDYPRGPVTTTDAKGRFVLAGLSGSTPIGLFAPDEPFGDRPGSVVRTFAEDVPLRITLRDDRPTSLADGEPRYRVDVVVSERYAVEKGGLTTEETHAVQAPIRLVRLDDGLTFRILHRELPLEIPPGPYRVTAGGGFSEYAPVSVDARLPLAGGAPLEITVQDRQPWLRIEADPGLAAAMAELRIPGGTRELRSPHHPGLIQLPAAARAVLVVEEPRTLVFPVPPSTGEVRVAKCVLPEPTVILLRVRDAAGKPLAAEVSTWPDVDEPIGIADDGRVRIETRAAGSVTLHIRAPHHVEREVELVLPDRTARIDLGEIVLERDPSPTSRLRAVTAAGEPAAGAVFVVEGIPGGPAETDAEGLAEVSLPPAPVEAEIRVEGSLPLPVTLSRDGPTDFRLPGGSLSLRIRNAGAEPLDAVVYLDSHAFECSGGELVIRGLTAGPHTLLVGARGYVGEVRRLSLAQDEARTLAITLPAR